MVIGIQKARGDRRATTSFINPETIYTRISMFYRGIKTTMLSIWLCATIDFFKHIPGGYRGSGKEMPPLLSVRVLCQQQWENEARHRESAVAKMTRYCHPSCQNYCRKKITWTLPICQTKTMFICTESWTKHSIQPSLRCKSFVGEKIAFVESQQSKTSI